MTGLQTGEPLDLDVYPVNREGGASFPKAGKYILQVQPAITFGQSKANALTASLDAVIVGPTNTDFKVRYIRVSAKQYPRKDASGTQRLASQMGDLLKACGVEGTFDGPQALADAVESTVGRSFTAMVDWRAYNKNNPGFEVKGMDNFPVGPNGERQPWTVDPDDIDPETNEPRRLRANLEVTRFIPATQ